MAEGSLPEGVAGWIPAPMAGVGPLALRVIPGASAPLVLIHGLGRVAATWWPVVAAAAGRLTLLLPDNPGLGRSSALAVPATIEAHASLHRRTLEAAGIAPPWHLVGLSLGGMIGIALAAELGPRAASLTILASSSRETGIWRLDPAALLRMGGRMVRHFSADHRVSVAELVRLRDAAELRVLAALWDEVQAIEGFRFSRGFRQLLAAARFRAAPYRDRLPDRRLVVVGTGDRLVPARNSRRLAALLDAPLREISGGGHDMSADAPEELVAILEEVARGRGAGAAPPAPRDGGA